MKKLDIKGASNFVNRMFEACGKFQWAREFLKNALEAHATRVDFGIEWQAVKRLGVYRRFIADNGDGMSAEQLLQFFSTLGEGGKKIGGVHDNFGVGAKIASLPWNPEGLVVISYKNGEGAMIWIYLDEDSGEYGLMEFQLPNRKTLVINPKFVKDEDGIDWDAVGPDWVKEHGTVIVLLGSQTNPNTILGNPNAAENDIKGLAQYLNTRFWEAGSADIGVIEVRSNKPNQWPQDENDKDEMRRATRRSIKGARHYLTEKEAKDGKLLHSDIAYIQNDRVVVEWYLWEGKRPQVHDYAKENGYIALRYNDELFQVTSGKVEFRAFGILHSSVQTNLTLILDPQHYQKAGLMWGVHPDQSRNQLHFSGNGEKGVQVPILDWGKEFAENMPEAIRDAIRKAQGELTGSINDEDYRKRLQERFGKRWIMKMLFAIGVNQGRTTSASEEQSQTKKEPTEGMIANPGSGLGISSSRKRRRVITATDGSTNTIERDVPVDVPRYEFGRAADFEQPWHLASWAPNHVAGPTVLINLDSPILQESIDYHLPQYLDLYAEEVTKTIQEVFGELAVAKVAHSQTLKKHVNETDLDAKYRSEEALTLALMGLVAEESVIAQRLKKLGQKKSIPIEASESVEHVV